MRSKKIKSASLQKLQRAFRLANESLKKEIPAKELLETELYTTWSRRKFIDYSGKAALLATLAGSEIISSAFTTQKKNKRVVVVGAGIAGLNAAYTLKKAGIYAEIYEGSSRTGGRMYSGKDILGKGLVTELGGEFLDSSHEDMFTLAKEFNLELLDTQSAEELKLVKEKYFLDKQFYTEEEIIEAFKPIAPQIQKDIDSLSDYISYKEHNDADIRLDNMNLAFYLHQLKASPIIYNLLSTEFCAEYGLDIEEQSALNFLLLINPDTSGGLKLLGESNERYKIKGGNQLICDNLATQLQSQIHTDHFLESIKSIDNGKTTTLSFIQSNGSAVSVVADYVILALPFSILREVDIQVNFPLQKLKAIKEISYGKNAKFFMGYKIAPWRNMGYAGYVISDNGIMNGWDNSQAQNQQMAGYTIFTGGRLTTDLNKFSNQTFAGNYIKKMDEIFPSASAYYNNISTRFYWPGYQYVKASYVCYSPGQYTSLSGMEAEPFGNIYFAGEHCSFEFQGFMNGAAQTGKLAAKKIIKKI